MKHLFFEYGFIACLGLCAGLPEARTGYISVFYFFYVFSGSWPLLPVRLSGVDDRIVWGACQAANHRPHRPRYGHPMAGSFPGGFHPPQLAINIYASY